MATLRNKNCQGVSVIEYAFLLVVIIGVFFVMQFYISRAIKGHWKTAGDSLGMGRQFQAGNSFDCTYMQVNADAGIWLDSDCYQRAVSSGCQPGDIACEDGFKDICAIDYCQPGNQ